MYVDLHRQLKEEELIMKKCRYKEELKSYYNLGRGWASEAFKTMKKDLYSIAATYQRRIKRSKTEEDDKFKEFYKGAANYLFLLVMYFFREEVDEKCMETLKR